MFVTTAYMSEMFLIGIMSCLSPQHICQKCFSLALCHVCHHSIYVRNVSHWHYVMFVTPAYMSEMFLIGIMSCLSPQHICQKCFSLALCDVCHPSIYVRNVSHWHYVMFVTTAYMSEMFLIGIMSC